MRKHSIIFFVLLNMCMGFAYAEEDNKPTEKEKDEALAYIEKTNNNDLIVSFKPRVFSFNSASQLILAADKQGEGQCSILYIGKDHRLLKGGYEKVEVDYEEDKPNPLYNQAISCLAARNMHMFAVTDDQPQDLVLARYLAGAKQEKILTAKNICDASGSVCKRIVSLSVGQVGSFLYVFAPVTNKDGMLGKDGSGIAVIKLDKEKDKKESEEEIVEEEEEKDSEDKDNEKDEEEKKEDEKPKREFLNIVDASSGQKDGNKAYPLNASLFDIEGGCADLAIDNVVMHWDDFLGCLFVGANVSTKSQATSDQGACSVLVGSLGNDTLAFKPLANLEAFTAENKNIVGVKGSVKSLSVHHLRAFHTSTGFSYLIIVGGNGRPEETNNQIYALPLVNNARVKRNLWPKVRKHHASLAKKNSEISSYVNPIDNRYFKARALTEPAKKPVDMTQADDVAAQVGAGQSLPGPISDVQIHNDAIYVSVEKSKTKHRPGVFHTQPIFDESGTIAAWTPWRRAAGTDKPIRAFRINDRDGLFWLMEKDEKDTFRLHHSRWSNGSYSYKEKLEGSTEKVRVENKLIALLEEEFKGSYGLTALIDIPYQTPGVSGDRLTSFCMAAGNKKIALIQTGHETDEDFSICLDGDISVNYLMGGSLKGLHKKKSDVLVCSGDGLDKIGSIFSATIASNGHYNWACVGGTGGIAILMRKDGSGWHAQSGIKPYFEGLFEDMTFACIGDYRYVKRITSDDTYLYVLTPDRLDCLELSQNNFSLSQINGKLKRITLATAKEFGQGTQTFFTDFCIVGDALLLGTTDGLYQKVNQADWQKVYLPEQRHGVLQLYPIRSTMNVYKKPQHVQLFVLSGSARKNVADVHRLYVHASENEGCHIELLPDQYYKDRLCNYIHFGSFRNRFVSDGGNYYALATRKRKRDPFLQIVKPAINTTLLRTMSQTVIPLPDMNIGTMMYNSAAGMWMVGGNFGIRMHK